MRETYDYLSGRSEQSNKRSEHTRYDEPLIIVSNGLEILPSLGGSR